MFLARAIAPQRFGADVTWSPLDSRWFTENLGLSGSGADGGVAVGPETIYLCDVVLAAVRFKAESCALCTPQAFRKLAGDDVQREPENPAEQLLRDPNEWMTEFQFTRWIVMMLTTWGEGYGRIVSRDDIIRELRGERWTNDRIAAHLRDRRGDGWTHFAYELRPMHPSRIEPVGQAADKSLIYSHRPVDSKGRSLPTEILSQAQVLHYRDLSVDTFAGMKTWTLIRNMVGVALAAERHTSTWLRKGTMIAGILSTDAVAEEDLVKRTVASWNSAFGGSDNSGSVAMVGNGLKFTPMAADHAKAQFLELQEHQVGKILRALGVPGVCIGWQGDKASTYASVEAFFKNARKTCIGVTTTNMEQTEEKALLPRRSSAFLERNLNVLMRPDTVERIKALVAACGGAYLTQNEARRIDNYNRHPDPSADRIAPPPNMTAPPPDSSGTGDPADEAPPPAPAKRKPAPADDPPADARLLSGAGDDTLSPALKAILRLTAAPPTATEPIATAAWRRARELAELAAIDLVRRETGAILGRSGGEKGAALRLASDPAAWTEWADTFYRGHAARVAQRLGCSPEAAEAYAAEQRRSLLEHGVSVVAGWESSAPPRLVELALAGCEA